VAAAVLALWILPAQQAALGGLDALEESAVGKTAARLGAATGVFNLLWASVTILMIVRPGSTTGA